MTMPLGTRQAIREMDRAPGSNRSQIARELGISRNTVDKYADMEDFSPRPPVPQSRPHPATDPYEETVAEWLEADELAPKKQRHTAKRVYDRLVAECSYKGSYESVNRLVGRITAAKELADPTEGFLELEWPCGTAQVDFGKAVAAIAGEERELWMLVVTLPHSNTRRTLLLPAHNAECLCFGLRAVFEGIGRFPRLMVFDNATEAGRMVRGAVTESETFLAFRTHYCCDVRFCNPYSGWEKGSVENAVGYLRRNAMVPVPRAESLEALNDVLAARCLELEPESRCRDGRPVAAAQPEDLAAMAALPGVGFDAVRWARARTDNRGEFSIDGHRYCAGPAWHNRQLVVGLRHDSVDVRADRGRRVCTLPRAYGDRAGTVRNSRALIPALVARPRAWEESPLRREMPPDLVTVMDAADKAGLRQALRSIDRAADAAGFDAAVVAAARIASSGRLPDEAGTDLLARRIAAGADVGEGPDLAAYDRLAQSREVA